MEKIRSRDARALRNPWPRAAMMMLVWCAVYACLALVAYILRGPAAALTKLDEFVFSSVVVWTIIPAMPIAQRAEPMLRRRFPAGAPFIVITLALVPSAALGFWLAINVTRLLR